MAIKLKNYFQAFMFIIKMFAMSTPLIGLWLGANFLVFRFLIKFWEKTCSDPSINTYCSENYFIGIQVLTFIIGFLFTLFLFYIIGLIIYMQNTEKTIEIKKSHKKKYHKEVIIEDWSNIKAIYYRARLSRSYKTFKTAVYREENEKITNYIKNFYPKFEYKQKWRPKSHKHNFNQALEIIDKINENPEILENVPITKESLKVTITNLENQKKKTFPVYDNRLGLKMFYSNMFNDKFKDGKRYKIAIKYKGLKGYNFKMWIKRD